MKTTRNFLISILLVALTSPLVAAQDIKIGAVNALRILEQSPQAEAAKQKIEKEFAPRDRQLVAKQKKVKGLEDKLAKDAAIMSESERKKLERDIVAEKRELRRQQDEFREDLNFRRNEEFAKIQKDILQTINEIAKSNGYDVILGEGVIFASPKVDLSNQVIEKLKSKQ